MVIILNAGARSAARNPGQTRSKVAALFGAAGVYPQIIVSEGKDVGAIARQAVAENEETIVAGGGDGTVSAVAADGRRARLNAGTLSLYLTHRTGWLGLLRLAADALFRRLKQAKNFEAYSVEEVFIEARRRPLLVATDGEVTLMESPLHYRVRPDALRVVVPQDGIG